MSPHFMVGSNDLDRSERFYDALFEVMAARCGKRDEHVLSYRHQGSLFMVRTPLDNARSTHGNGSTIGFNLGSPAQSREERLSKIRPEFGRSRLEGLARLFARP